MLADIKKFLGDLAALALPATAAAVASVVVLILNLAGVNMTATAVAGILTTVGIIAATVENFVNVK